MVFVKKNLLNLIKNGRENYIYQLAKKSLNLIKKRGGKPKDLINKKLPKLNKKTKKKTIICYFINIYCFIKYKKPPKSNKKNREENLI